MLGIDPGLVDAIAIGVGSPLWFLAAYMVVQALTPLMNALHERYGARVLGVLFAAALAVDLVRQRLVVVVGVSNVPSDGYGFGQELIGIPNIVFVWLFAQQVGFVMFDGWYARRTWWQLLTIMAGGCGVLAASVPLVGYSWSMLGNQWPPTATMAVLAVI